MNTPDYDIIVIGSGAGGLTAAVALAQAGKRVLVLEQHEVAGGWCHTFTLEGYRFSPGVHYIGGLQPGGSLRRIYQGLGVTRDLAFTELNPEGYDHIFIGDQRFDLPKGKDNLVAALGARFPHEQDGIAAYFDAIVEFNLGLKRLARIRGMKSGWRALRRSGTTLRFLFRSGQDMIHAYVNDPILQGVLAGQAGDHGLPPSRVSAAIHAGVVHHYLDGGYYPLGGAFAIPRAFTRALKRAGGELRLSTPVEEIVVEHGRVRGVRLGTGEVLHAPVVVSNADPEATFGKMIGREKLSRKLRRRLDTVEYSGSALSLFMAVDMDLKGMGLDSGNYWFYEDEDVDGIYARGLGDDLLNIEESPGLFLTVTTLKDPSKMHAGHHTLEAFSFINYDPFEKWADLPVEQRGTEYKALKSQLADKMFRAIERRIPGFRENVVFCELGTPITNQHYINAHKGNLYGIAKSRFQVGPLAFPIKTEIDGLYLCGASTISHGVAGATASGLEAAKRVLGVRTTDLLIQDGPDFPVYPADDLNAWPAHLQKRAARGREPVTS